MKAKMLKAQGIRRRAQGVIASLVVVLAMSLIVGCAHTIGKKPVLTMGDVKKLGPADLGEFAITLYNERADWYKFQLADPSSLTDSEKKALRKEYDLLKDAWPFMENYDRIVTGGGVPSQNLRLELYKFIQNFLGGQ